MRAASSEDRSLGELVGEMGREIGDLVRKEIELAKVEAKEAAGRAAKTGVFFGAMGVMAFQAVTLMCFALAWALAAVMPWSIAFLIASAVFGGVSFVLYARARRELSRLKPSSTNTIETLKEDVRWAKTQLS